MLILARDSCAWDLLCICTCLKFCWFKCISMPASIVIGPSEWMSEWVSDYSSLGFTTLNWNPTNYFFLLLSLPVYLKTEMMHFAEGSQKRFITLFAFTGLYFTKKGLLKLSACIEKTRWMRSKMVKDRSHSCSIFFAHVLLLLNGSSAREIVRLLRCCSFA